MARTYVGFYQVGTLNGSPPAVKNFDLKGATAFYEGAVLRLNSSGSAVKAAAGIMQLLGVAGANVTSSASTTKMPVFLADNNNVFEAKMLGTGAPKGRYFSSVRYRVGTTHNFRLEGTEGTVGTCQCRVVGAHPDDLSGTATGKRYRIVFNQKTSLLGDARDTE